MDLHLPHKSMKTTKYRNPTLLSLPHDMLSSIIASVAASSAADLANAKFTCKEFHEAAKDEYVFRQVSLQTLPACNWKRSAQLSSFLNRCEASGNPDALYKQGMYQYFSNRNLELGLELLKRAADSGHPEATYLLGIILFSDRSSKVRGIDLLNKVESLASIANCRRRSKNILHEFWINNVLPRRRSSCLNASCGVMKRSRSSKVESSWSQECIDYNFCSDSCKWGYEFDRFCDSF